ncbi:hypothetical protein CE91St19_20910 [Odoribacter laneus]|nr:hypothetical protein CE91St19_20910 [Odoribacter laneus]GKI25132.1 hypothetical protein CE91St20_12690 [Odoribacter laneus]
MKIRILQYRDVIESMRFDGSYHNADVNVYDSVIKKHSHHKLSHYCSEIFSTGRNKRTYTTPEFGYPFLSNSDVVAAEPFMSCKYCSRKYDFDDKAVLKAGMILTGRVGAIGQTSFVPSYLEKAKAMGSDNIIRIVVKSEYRKGFIYAYLSSKMGQLSFWKYATGGVQPFITETMVGSLPVPNFSEALQKKIDDLILESTKLREDAFDKLKEAQDLILNELRINISKRYFGKVSISSIMQSHNSRFEANFHISEGADIDRYLWSQYKCKPLGNLCTSISRPNIFKRYYVNHGITFLGGADIFLATPNSDKQLSKKKTENINDLLIEEGTILLPRSGTIGNVAWAHAGHAQKLASEDVIRLKPNDILRGGYLFAFLSTSIGRSLIQKHIFGSVIQHVEAPHLSLIPIPILDDRIISHAHEKVITYSKSMGEAIKKESQAIALVEQEIESWNKK